MNLNDIEKLHAEGFITDEQRRRIVDHFKLEGGGSRLLTVFVGLGGVLVLFGIILVISANWDAIPGLVKIACGALLLIAAHAAGWWLRSVRQSSPSAGEALHFIGAGLFLANIALVGQVYHLSARSPNAVLFWLAGIIPLAWILRAVSVHALSLIGLLVWVGMEINAHDGWLHFADHTGQLAVYGAIGLLYYGAGLALRRSSFSSFAAITEILGLMLFHFGLWPALVTEASRESTGMDGTLVLAGLPALAGLGLAAWYFKHLTGRARQWRILWLGALTAWALTSLGWMAFDTGYRSYYLFGHMGPMQMVVSIILVIGALLQMRVAEELRTPWMLNLAILTTAYAIIASFCLLIGSMMDTGLIFVVGGGGILGLGIWLERKRRAVLRRINA